MLYLFDLLFFTSTCNVLKTIKILKFMCNLQKLNGYLLTNLQFMDSIPIMKITDLMDIPPVVLVCRLFAKGNKQIYYPAALLELWRRCTQPPHDSPSGLCFLMLALKTLRANRLD